MKIVICTEEHEPVSTRFIVDIEDMQAILDFLKHLHETKAEKNRVQPSPEKPLRGMVWTGDEELPTGV